MQNRRITKLRSALSIAALLILFLATVFTTVMASHHCEGENCSICLALNVVKTNLKLLVIALAAEKTAGIILRKKLFCKIGGIPQLSANSSLILLKTRLND